MHKKNPRQIIMNTSERIHNCYLNAAFNKFVTESSLDWIVSLNRYVSVAWLGNIVVGHRMRDTKTQDIWCAWQIGRVHKVKWCYLYTCKEQVWSDVWDLVVSTMLFHLSIRWTLENTFNFTPWTCLTLEIGLLKYSCACSEIFMTVSAFELLSTGLGASLSIQVGLSNNKGTAVLMVVVWRSFTLLILGCV